MDYKLAYLKQKELIDYLISCIENGFDYQARYKLVK
jgi:hypothetical protein